MYFDISMERYCNTIGCEGPTKRLQSFNAKYPTRYYYIFDRKELGE